MTLGVPFYRHQLGSPEQLAISSSLEANILTSGSIGKSVEKQLTNFFEVKHAKLVNSWTNGWLALLLALKVGPGDEVILPSMTFIACANAIRLVGAIPVFVDVDARTLLMTPELTEDKITENTKVILVVHLYGQMVDMRGFNTLSSNHNIYLVEDAAHSFEATRENYKPGQLSTAAIFSFYATKNITCGEGGAVITNDSNIFDILQQTVLHGMTAGAADRFNQGIYKHWNMNLLGTKANLPDILASLLPTQINNCLEKLELRKELVKVYDNYFHELGVITPHRHGEGVHSHHLYPIWVEPAKRDLILNILGTNSIGTTVNFRPVHKMNYYRSLSMYSTLKLVNSETWGDGVISLPLFPGLTEKEQAYVLEIFEEKISPELKGKN